ncbi:bcl-2-like protein 12 isoform X5 [Rattus norvegicus]|uniref:bcl-2-like protein 12 isoform X5 n=1 Tax=Rattus norvegicus TaxID=10116 RepID=UPI001917382E|nr:bcl-2-like protein 12 isoform X4 [Rattus norvegicus]XP_038938086.1 bcl-2-like protein 12 isoform X4 [Rattus norvegicus]
MVQSLAQPLQTSMPWLPSVWNSWCRSNSSLRPAQLASDPALHRKLARLSAGSFARLVELFSSRGGSSSPNCSSPSMPCPGPPPPSPDPLARLALAMELSRRVAGLGGTLASLSIEHVHSFAPWIQAHGGWAGILATSPVDLNLPLD